MVEGGVVRIAYCVLRMVAKNRSNDFSRSVAQDKALYLRMAKR